LLKKIPSNRIPLIVVLSSLGIAVLMVIATWNINFWPSDAKVYYFDAAVHLPQYKYLSQMHQTMDAEKVYWLHGKEIYIVWASLFQRLLNDFQTLRPFMVLGSLSICMAGILLFFILRRIWGDYVGLMCYMVFATSFWSYMYILMAKHPPLGLFYALLAIYLLIFPQKKKWNMILAFVSGVSMGLALFSSNVSPLYLPFYLGAFLYSSFRRNPQFWKNRTFLLRETGMGLLVLLGLMSSFVYVNLPDVWSNFSNYVKYVRVSGKYNHFFYNQPHAQQWFKQADLSAVRGGWLWVIKYFFVMMPVLFPVYLIAMVYLLRQVCRSRLPQNLIILSVCLLSLTPMLMAEYAQVAQYGTNYFPCMMGIIFLLGFCHYTVQQDTLLKSWRPRQKKKGLIVVAVLLLWHVSVNAYAFFTDVYPCRMVTTFLSNKMKQLKVNRFYTYQIHPQHHLFALNITPELYRKIRFIPLDYIVQPETGYIMVPPVTGDSIYIAATSTYGDFDADIFLNELIRRKTLPQYAVASFKSIASSQYWLHEEEIMSYRRLILNHKIPVEELKTRVWLLDAKKITENKGIIIPDKEYLNLFQNNLRNIGTRQKVYLYDGYTAKVTKPVRVKSVIARLHKRGEPKDHLRVFVYRIDKKQEVLVPFNEYYASNPLSGESVLTDASQGIGVFNFEKPLDMPIGRYFFIIFRDGHLSDKNYYRINKDYLGLI